MNYYNPFEVTVPSKSRKNEIKTWFHFKYVFFQAAPAQDLISIHLVKNTEHQLTRNVMLEI